MATNRGIGGHGQERIQSSFCPYRHGQLNPVSHSTMRVWIRLHMSVLRAEMGLPDASYAENPF